MSSRSTSARTQNSRICASCGAALADSAAYCTACGAASAKPAQVPGQPGHRDKAHQVFVEPRPAQYAVTERKGASTGGAAHRAARAMTVTPSGRPASSGVSILKGDCGGTVVIEAGTDDLGSAPALRVLLIMPDGERLTVALTSESDQLVIGRDSGACSLSIPDPHVSGRHMVLGVSGDTGYVQDLDSTNGTFVNGVRVKMTHALNDGDVIRLGHSEITYHRG